MGEEPEKHHLNQHIAHDTVMGFFIHTNGAIVSHVMRSSVIG